MWLEGSTQILGMFYSEFDFDVPFDSELEIMKEENLLDVFIKRHFN